MLVLTRKQGERITIDHCITITVGQIRGKTVRIGIEAPVDVRVMRAEVENPPSECHCFGCETRRNQKRNELTANLRRFYGTDKPRFVADEDVEQFDNWMKGR